ncbi:MAG: DUF5317 domain-containing protein [Tissierellia bacterium]|nr:DUF5317 domain-containing protein [Tissierellia bacterium]
MLIEAIIISIVVGIIRGGKLRRLKALTRRGMWILIFGIAIQYILFLLSGLGDMDMNMVNGIVSYSREIQILSYILILLGIAVNMRYRASKLLLGGYLMNFMAVWGNHWKVPILSEAIPLIDGSGLEKVTGEGISLYTPIANSTKLPILGNIIVLADPYPLAKMISIGDVVVGIGIFLLIQEVMLGRDSLMRR